jgi:hypothetical protein
MRANLRGGLVKNLLLLIAAASVMAACADSTTAPAAPKKALDPHARQDDFTCRSGYTVAYDENGNPYCVANDGSARRSGP